MKTSSIVAGTVSGTATAQRFGRLRPRTAVRSAIAGVAVLLVLLCGCVERSLTVRSEPPGAVVVVNDEEIGASPAKFSFLWYGDYEIILRKPGYETLTTFHRVPAPWYQYPPFDFFAEILIPGTIQDNRETPVYVLSPRTEPSVDELIRRAEQTRSEAGGAAQ